jgi:putative spermidine/putrescine transport system permease protein
LSRAGEEAVTVDSMRARWELVLIPPAILSAALLIISQTMFLKGSLHEDLGFGRLSPIVSLHNFFELLADSYYLESLWLSFVCSAAATLMTTAIALPVAYIIARMQSRWASVLLSAVIIASFITIVIKVLGLLLIFSSNGPFNSSLRWLGLIDRPVTIIGTIPGVILGLMYYTLGFAVLLFYSVIVTIPRSLEEAAEIHGSSRWGVIRQVVLPLCFPGLAAGALTVFNVSMGGFSSTALIGGGKVLTLPIVIQRTVMQETNYGMGAAVAVLLLCTVLAINIWSSILLARGRSGGLA